MMNTFLSFILFLGFLTWSPKTSQIENNSSATQSWSEELNTASRAVYLNDYEKRIIFELNKVRSDPSRYATEYLEPLRSAYDGLRFSYPGSATMMTREGVSALEECIQALKAAQSVEPLMPSKGLSSAAKLLVNDQRLYGGSGHTTKSGWTTEVRIRRYGEWKVRLAENLVYGYEDPRMAVISLLIDDGTEGRGHRANILSSDFGVVGVSADTHPDYRFFCAIEFAGDFIETD